MKIEFKKKLKINMSWIKILIITVTILSLWFIYKRLPRRKKSYKSKVAYYNQPRLYISSFPRDFIESQFPINKQQQMYRDRYIGTFMNAGVIYDEQFLRKQNMRTLREPATFTPFAQDYVHYVKRPKVKTFPLY
jgi:hypothetical protein